VKARQWMGAVAGVVLSFTVAGAAEIVGVCTTTNGNKKQCVEFRPRATPTPVPTATPIPTATPRPTPACSDSDRFSKISANHWRKQDVNLEVGVERILCADLPAKAFPFFEIFTINLGNASCSNLEMTAIAPDGTWTIDVGPAPGVRPRPQAGRWLVKLYLPWGCTKYEFNVAY